MQVVCANCQLSFQAPDGAAGLMCPICRSPLKPPEAAGQTASAAPERQVVEWAGGTLDDLISILSGPAWSAHVEVLAAGKPDAVGEVHVIAGGVSDALYEGKSEHDSLDRLRAVKGARFRIEPRLPGPTDGNLNVAGPDQGKLEERPLATLMRYCEDFVLTCGIEVWRGNENSKVDYRRGEIVGVTVGGIDAPERLAEVMKWASGNYRLIVPKLTLPETAPKTATAPAPAPVVPRSTGAASKTIFGMPALDAATIAAAAAKSKSASTTAATVGATAPAAVAGPPAAAVAPVAAPPATTAPPAKPGASSQNPARATLVGTAPLPTAKAVDAAGPALPATATPAAAPPAQAAVSAPDATPGSGRTNTNRTIFGVSAPVIPQPASPEDAKPPAETRPAATNQAAPQGAPVEAKPAPAAAKQAKGPAQKSGRPSGAVQTTHAPTSHAPVAQAKEEDRTSPTKTSRPAPAKSGETAVWTYVGVGFVFGLALLGVYRLVMVFTH